MTDPDHEHHTTELENHTMDTSVLNHEHQTIDLSVSDHVYNTEHLSVPNNDHEHHATDLNEPDRQTIDSSQMKSNLPDHDYYSSSKQQIQRKNAKTALRHRLKTHLSTVPFMKPSLINNDSEITAYQGAKLKLTLSKKKIPRQ